MSLASDAPYFPVLSERALQDAAQLLAQIDDTAHGWQQIVLEHGEDRAAAQYVDGIRVMLRNSVYRALYELLGRDRRAS